MTKSNQKKLLAAMIELELSHGNVSVEAVGLFAGTSEAFKRLTSHFTKAKDAIKLGLNGIKVYFSGKKNNEYLDGININDFTTFTTVHNYAAVPDLMVRVPEGFTGNLALYSKDLLDILETYTATFIDNMVTPFSNYINQLINNPALLQSQVFQHAVKSADTEKMKKTLAKYVKGRRHVEVPFKEAFARMADVTEYGNTALQIVSVMEANGLGKIKEHVDKTNESLTVLLEVIEKGTVQPNAKVISAISDLIFDLAKQVEFIAVVDSLVHSLLYATRINSVIFKRATTQVSKEEIKLIKEANDKDGKGLLYLEQRLALTT